MSTTIRIRLATIAVWLALWLPLVVLNGWAFSILWGWFIFPVFGVELGVYQAIGLMTVVGFILQKVPPNDDDEPIEDTLIRNLVWFTTKPLVCLAMGWIYKMVFS